MQEMWERWIFYPWVRKIPGVANGNELQDSCLEEFHGQRSWQARVPWCHKSETQQHICICEITINFFFKEIYIKFQFN